MLKQLLFLYLFAATPVFAEAEIKDITDPPRFDFMGSIGNNSALTMTCYGEPPFQEIDCNFTQVMISAVSVKDLAERKLETAKEFEKLKQKDVDGLKKELTSVTMQKVESRMKNATFEQQAYAQDLVSIFKSLASSNDKASFKKAAIDQQDMEGATCSINLNTFEQHFTRISKNKWLHNPGPTGLCNVVRISTLAGR